MQKNKEMIDINNVSDFVLSGALLFAINVTFWAFAYYAFRKKGIEGSYRFFILAIFFFAISAYLLGAATFVLILFLLMAALMFWVVLRLANNASKKEKKSDFLERVKENYQKQKR